MRIGIDISVLNEPNRTGIPVYNYELVKALLKVNNKDQFVLFAFAPFANFNYMKNLEFKNYPNVEMRIYKMPARFFRLMFLFWQKLNWPDIEFFTGSIDLFHSFNWFLPPQRNGKKIATVFDLTSITNPEWHNKKTTQLDIIRFQRIKKLADLVIAISESAKRDFLEFSPNSRVEVVYPAANGLFKENINEKKIHQILKKYNLKPGYFLSVATLEPRKNIALLIKAYLKTNSSRQLILVGGQGWKNNEIMELARKNKKKIILLGFIPTKDLPVIYNQSLCLLYPSLYEGFGIPVLEALKSGTVVVTSEISSLPEVGGQAVIYVDPYNIKSVIGAIKKAESGRYHRKIFINSGLKQSKKFSWKKSALALDRIYHNL